MPYTHNEYLHYIILYSCLFTTCTCINTEVSKNSTYSAVESNFVCLYPFLVQAIDCLQYKHLAMHVPWHMVGLSLMFQYNFENYRLLFLLVLFWELQGSHKHNSRIVTWHEKIGVMHTNTFLHIILLISDYMPYFLMPGHNYRMITGMIQE